MVAGGGRVWLLGGACVVARGGMHGCSRGGMCGCLGGCMVSLGRCVWLLRGGMRGCFGGGREWDTTRYADTVNEWAVRILLECILVILEYSPFLCDLCHDIYCTVAVCGAFLQKEERGDFFLTPRGGR